MKIEIKHRNTEEVLFSHSCENNTIKETVLQAIKNNADLRYSDLRHTDLRHINLSHADFYNADLRHTNLSHTNLSYTNLRNSDLDYANLIYSDLYNSILRNADLRHTNLRHANLYNTSLRHANLYNTVGNSKEIKTIQTSKWTIVMTKKVMAIGCEQHKFKKWMKFTDDEISDMNCNALEFWKNWKKIIKKMHKLGFEK